MMKKAISLGKLEVVEDIPTTPLVSASKKKGVSKAEGIKRYIDDILSTYIPDRGGVSTDAREGLKADILELVESAVVATVSHIPESKKVFTVADVNAMFKESMKEVLPEIVEAIQSGNKSTGYGPARNKDWDSLAKSIPVKAWGGPSERSWEIVRLDVKKNAKIHNCLGIIDGTLKEPTGRTVDPDEYKIWETANSSAMILLANTFTSYEQSKEIILLYTEEDDLDADAYECWTELDTEFDDDGVYDRVTLEDEYDTYVMKPNWSPSRFVTKLNNIRKKLMRVGLIKDDETFYYDILKKLPDTGEYDTQGMEIQKCLRPRELMKKRKPRPTDEEIENAYPLPRLQDIKDLLRTKEDWMLKRKRNGGGKRKPGNPKKAEDGGETKKHNGDKSGGGGKTPKKKDLGMSAGDSPGGKGTYACWKCGKEGHSKKDCPMKAHPCDICDAKEHVTKDCPELKTIKENRGGKKGDGKTDKPKDSHSDKKPGGSLAVRSAMPGEEVWSPLDGGPTRLETGYVKKVTLRTECKFISDMSFVSRDKVATDRVLGLKGSNDLLFLTGDSGASGSMSFADTKMVNYRKSTPKSHFVETADGTEYEVKGYGEFKGTMVNMNGEKREMTVRDVQHIPELTETLLSLRTCTKKKGCTFVQNPTVSYIELPDGDRFAFQDDGRGLEHLVMTLDRTTEESNDKAFTIKKKKADPGWEKPVVDAVDINDLHTRTGHCCKEDLEILAEDFGIVLQGELTHCEACARVKGKRNKFRKEAIEPATRELERVCVDTTGPFPAVTLQGHKYMFLFVDEKKQHNGKHLMWEYFTKEKDELTGYYTVRQFLLEREREVGSVHGMKLRSDNGTEYKNSSVTDLLLEKHVKPEYTSADGAEENGIVERAIPIQVTRAMAMLAHAGLLKTHPELLEEAIRHSVYLNQRGILAEKGEEFVRVANFGSVTWVHIPKDDRRKHDERAQLGLYMGVSKTHSRSAHKVYMVESKELVANRHVEIWDGIYLHQLLKKRQLNLPLGPISTQEELDKGNPILVQYDMNEGVLRKDAKETGEVDVETEEDVPEDERERRERAIADEKKRLDEATERYLKANKIPYKIEDGIYVVEKYQHARARTRKKYKNLMLRKDFVVWKREQEAYQRELERAEARVGKTGAAEFKGLSGTDKAMSVKERIDLAYLLEYILATRDAWDQDDKVEDVTSQVDDEVEGLPIHYEEDDPGMESSRMDRDLKKEMAFSARVKPILDKALAAAKSKSNHRNFPKTVQEAMSREDWPQWKEAIKKELSSIIKKGTFRNVQSSKRAKGKPLGTMMVLTIKYNADGTIERYKARFVVLGNHQVFGESYDETYAPTASMMVVRQVFAYAAEHRLPIHQLDVRTAFLNAEMDYEVDVRLDPATVKVLQELATEIGIEPLNDDCVKRLGKALYGLKQAPRQWYAEVSNHLKTMGFEVHPVQECLFMKTYPDGKRVWVLLFVDDMVIIGDREGDVLEFKKELTLKYEIEDLGISKKFLGMKVSYLEEGIKLSLDVKTLEMLERFNMSGSNPVSTPASEGLADELYKAEMNRREGLESEVDFPVREAVGAMLYLAMMVRPDICNAVRELSRYLEHPTMAVVKGIKRVLRYLSGTVDYGIVFYYGEVNPTVEGYCDASYAGDKHKRKSVSGYMIFVNGSIIDWKSQLQPCIAQSTMESEYMALAVMTNTLRVLRLVRAWFGYADEGAYIVYEDNDACEHLAKGAGKGMKRGKHIDIRFHVVREAVKNNEIEIFHLATAEQIADTLTKDLSEVKFNYHLARYIGV